MNTQTDYQLRKINNALADLRCNLEQTEAAVHYVNEKWAELPIEIRGKVDRLVTLHVTIEAAKGQDGE